MPSTSRDLHRDRSPLSGPVAGHPHRWATLAVMCWPSSSPCSTAPSSTSLCDFAIKLGATTAATAMIVDAYLLVFTGLLLAAGGLGDRCGASGSLYGRPPSSSG